MTEKKDTVLNLNLIALARTFRRPAGTPRPVRETDTRVVRGDVVRPKLGAGVKTR